MATSAQSLVNSMASYDKWRGCCIVELQNKLKSNVEKRKVKFESVVNNAVHQLMHNKELSLSLSDVFPFKISALIESNAIDRMCEVIAGWKGVDVNQCKNAPKIFRKYKRLADNWWNRQKGAHFGLFLFFYLRFLHNNSIYSFIRRSFFLSNFKSWTVQILQTHFKNEGRMHNFGFFIFLHFVRYYKLDSLLHQSKGQSSDI